jgi:catechol 2,3-dioxygenase-like lactoylglutathione lyase family enzyme
MTDAPSHTFHRAMPVLDVSDMARSIAFYRDKLGFAVSTWGEPATFAICQRGHVTLALAKAQKPSPSKNWAAYVYVTDADALYREFTALNVTIEDPPTTQAWNCRDFIVDDPDGHMLAFGHVIVADRVGPGLSDRMGRDGGAS